MSTRMISTAGLELTNLLNPDLTWKTVTKGNRSTTRRTRKPGGRNLTVGVKPADYNGHKRAEQTTVSESEKLGVAILGRRFNDEIEHVPIKKRKFNFHSSSPPSHAEVVQHASDQGACPNSNGKRLLLAASSEPIISHDVVDVKISDSVKEKVSYREDFSGIEILAAAACDNSFDADADHPEEKLAVEGSVQENYSAMFVEDAVAPVETANCPSRDTDRTEDTSVQDITAAFVQNSSNENDNKIIERSLPSRLHWDLNVVMDAWKEPSDSLSVGSQTKDVEVSGREDQHILEDCETERETNNVKHDNMVDVVVSSEVHEKTHISSDLRGLANESDREDNQLEACSGLDRNHDECGADPKESLLPSYPQEKTECCASGVKEDEIVPAEIVQVENYDAASPHIPALDGASCEAERNTPNENGEDSGRASCLQNDVNASQEMTSVDYCELSDPIEVEPASISGEVGVDHPSPRCEDVATSSESSKEAQPVVTEEAKGETNYSVHIGSEKLSPMSSGIVTATLDTGYTNEECGGNAPSNSSCKISFEESCDDIYLSDTSHDDKVHTVRMENCRELQDGYDSQFEDGELRETDAHCWEENDCEGAADIEQVDYESECEGERLCIYESEDIDNKRKFESGSSPGSGEVTEKSEQGAVGDAFGDSLMSSEVRISEAAQGNKTKKDTAACEEESRGKDFTSRMVGAGASRREMLCAQGSLSSDILQKCRSDNFDDLCPQSERVSDPNSKFMGRDRFSMHMRHRSPGGSHIVNSSQSPPHRGPYGSGRPRPRSVVESHGIEMTSDRKMLETTGVEGFDSRVRRQYMSSSSNSVYQPFNRRPLGYRVEIYSGTAPIRDDISPDRSRFRRYTQGISRGFREDCCRPMPNYPNDDYMPQRMGRRERSISPLVYRPFNRRPLGYRDEIYTRTAPIRDDISPDRSRFRRYPQGISRGFREDCRRPMPHYPNDEYMPQRMGRRERSISPLGERHHYILPYKKPQSRSRSRSPNAWLSTRERNEGSRRRSRSPDFRSTRINRVRAPFKKRFEGECEEGFMSSPRNRISPQRNPSRFDDRIPGLDNFRDRKSPVRMFRLGQRFDSSRPFRPEMPPRRFPDIGGAGAGRGYKYEDGDHDDRRKPGNRYEVIHRARHYDNDGVGVTRRLRYNNNSDDSIVANEKNL